MYASKLAQPNVTSSGSRFVHPVQPLASSGAAKELIWFTNSQLAGATVRKTNPNAPMEQICITTTGVTSGGRALICHPTQNIMQAEVYHNLAPLSMVAPCSSSAGESCDERGSISSSGSALSPQSTGMSGGIMNYGPMYGGGQSVLPTPETSTSGGGGGGGGGSGPTVSFGQLDILSSAATSALISSSSSSAAATSSSISTATTSHQAIVSTTQRKRKGHGSAGKSIEEEICLICGDRASGYHYNALSCEGCKGFFRRSITRGASYICKYGGECEMDMWMRRRCQACRLKRCREAGMKEECLLSDDQCKARDARRKARQKISPRNVDAVNLKAEQMSPSTITSNPPMVKDPLEALTADQKILLEKIVLYQDEFELPNEEDVKRVSEVKISDTGRPKDVSEAIYKHMAEMTVLVTQLVVEFAKCLPGFSDLEREDQITLLKGSACEVMMIRTARRYDIETDTVIFANGIPFSKEDIAFGGMRGYVDGMFQFCYGMAKLGVDNAEYALITSICIFSDRPHLVNAKKVESLQEIYVACLREYEKHRRPKGSNSFAKLLMKLTELRTLSIKHSDVLFALKVEKGSLPPLLNEYFDVDNRDLR